MYGFEGLGLSGVQLSISELSVVGGGWVGGGGRDKRTSWSDLVGVRQKLAKNNPSSNLVSTTWYYMQSHTIIIIFQVILGQVLIMIAMTLVSLLVQSPSVPSMVHLWLAICQVETKNQRP